MNKAHHITEKTLTDFRARLEALERSERTCCKYCSDVRAYVRWSANGLLDEAKLSAWKEHLLKDGKAPASVNSMIAALNSYCSLTGLPFRERYLSVQRAVFRPEERILTAKDLNALISCAARNGNEQFALLICTMAETGIRVSEVPFITAEALRVGYTSVFLKRKIRTIFLSDALCKRLLAFASREKIRSGSIFLKSPGQPLTRNQIWRGMKQLSRQAGVPQTKVFPHNLRHLFAAEYYRASHGDIVLLSDALGHSSLETTRVYLRSASSKHRRNLSRMRAHFDAAPAADDTQTSLSGHT